MRIRHIHSLDTPAHALFSRLTAVLEGALGELPCQFERIITMGVKTQAAIDALVAEAQDSKTKLEGLITVVEGFPNVVAQAVADALTQAGVDDEAQASAISAVTTEISNAVDAAVDAAGTDTGGEPVPDAPDSPVGEDTTGEAA